MTRFAATNVNIDGAMFTNHVVELQGATLIRHYPLTHELPHTQWVRTLIIREGQLVHVEHV